MPKPNMSLPFRTIQLSAEPDHVKKVVLSGGLVPYFRKSGMFTLGGVGRYIKWHPRSDGSLFGKLGYFRSKNQCVFRFRIIFTPRETGTEVILRVEHGPFSLILKFLLFAIGLCMCGVGVVLSFILNSAIKRGQGYILQYLQGHLVDWDQGRSQGLQIAQIAGAVPPPVPERDPEASNQEGESVASSIGSEDGAITDTPPPLPGTNGASTNVLQDGVLGEIFTDRTAQPFEGPEPLCKDNALSIRHSQALSRKWPIVGILTVCGIGLFFILTYFDRNRYVQPRNVPNEVAVNHHTLDKETTSPATENRSRPRLAEMPTDAEIIDQGLLHESYSIQHDKTSGEMVVKFSWPERFGAKRYRATLADLDLDQVIIGDAEYEGAFAGSVFLEIPVRPGHQVPAEFWDSTSESFQWSQPPDTTRSETEKLGVHARGREQAARLVEALQSLTLAERNNSRSRSEMGQAPTTDAVNQRNPEETNANLKLIVGKWLETKYVIFYPDGTWGVQRHEEAPINTDGRRWSLSGDRLTRTVSGEAFVERIVALDRVELRLKDASGKVRVYKWVAPGTTSDPQGRDKTGEVAETSIRKDGETAHTQPMVGGGVQADPNVAMPGEKYPETRLRPLSPADVKKLTDDELRYAINEMFARHGGAFGKEEISRVFGQYSWYRPRADVTFDQIEEEFSKIEKENLGLIGADREARASGAGKASALRSSKPSTERNSAPFYEGTWVMRNTNQNAKDIDYLENTLRLSGRKFTYTMKYKCVLRSGAPPWSNPKISKLRSFSGATVYSGSIVDVGENTFGAKIESVTITDKSPLDTEADEKIKRRSIGITWKYVYQNGRLMDARNTATAFSRP